MVCLAKPLWRNPHGPRPACLEQKLAIALDIRERLYVMGHGQIVFEGSPRDVRENAAMRKEWLEV